MRIVLAIIVLAIIVGLASGGRIRALSLDPLRLGWLALVGLGLQVAPVPGAVLPLVLLLLSFGVLAAFSLVNLRRPGFPLVLLGLLLNLTVIGVNGGMPVSEDALRASGQADTLQLLLEDGGAKHHLAGPEDRLLFLGDVIALPPPARQAISVGDIVVFVGVFWLIVATMTRGRREEPLDARELTSAPSMSVAAGSASGGEA